MKKLGVVIFMVIIVGLYAMSIKNAGEDRKSDGDNEVTAVGQEASIKIETLSKKIDAEYPDTPKKVIEMHNEFMSIGYSSQISEQDVPNYVDEIRRLYSEEFKKINPVATQKEMLANEINDNSKKALLIISSQTGDVIVMQNNFDYEPDMAEVVVKHSTNQGDLIRKYTLIEENDQWKIHGWEKQEDETVNSEE